MMVRKESENRKDCWANSGGGQALALHVRPVALQSRVKLHASLPSFGNLVQTAAVEGYNL